MGVMSNREKFIQIFGIDIKEIDSIEWGEPYRKLKKYHVVLDSSRFWGSLKERHDCKVAECYIYATSKNRAKEKAIEKFGNKYKRYAFTGTPMYAVKVEEVE